MHFDRSTTIITAGRPQLDRSSTKRKPRGPYAGVSLAALLVALLAVSGWAGDANQPATAPDGSSQASVPSEPEEVDLGLFARVMTSDPSRLNGARSGRLEEFHADDVFLTTEISPEANGSFRVPAYADGRGSVGLEWAERRVLRQLSLEFDAAPKGLAPDAVSAEYWSSEGREDSWAGIGQTPWQGRWEKLPATVEPRANRWLFSIDSGAVPEFQNGKGVFKVRWVFPSTDQPVFVRRPSALGKSQWTTGEFRIERPPGGAGAPVEITAYNGLLLDGDPDSSLLRQTWNSSESLRRRVRHCVPEPSKSDRTLLRFRVPEGMCSVALEDVLESGAVYVEDYGIFIARQDTGMDLARYQKKTAGARSILDRTRGLPDQTLERAMEALWRPAQNHGPMLLSLACDNHKFIVPREGGLEAERLVVTPQFGSTQTKLPRMSWGTIGIDTTVCPPGRKGRPLRIKERTYAKGIGLHANAELIVQLSGLYEQFEAEIGVLPSGQAGGTVVFQVEVDGEVRFDSGTVTQQDAAQSIRVPLAGAERLLLRVANAGDGITNDAANWANVRLLRSDPGASPRGEYLSDLYARDRRTDPEYARRLEGRWLPIPVTAVRDGPITYGQRTCVVPYGEKAPHEQADARSHLIPIPKALCVVEYSLENSTDQPREASLRIQFSGKGDGQELVQLRAEQERILVVGKEALLACVDTSGAVPLQTAVSHATLSLTGELPPKTAVHILLCIPSWEMKPQECQGLSEDVGTRRRVEEYWTGMLRPAMQVHVPDALVEDVVRATQVHCLIAARNEEEGRLVAPWIASMTYGPLDSEAQAVILGMDLMGHDEFARRCLEFFANSLNEDGLLVRGYTLMGTGQYLWTLGAHEALTRDRQWLRRIAPKLRLAGRWISRQLDKTKRLDARGEKVPEYGLMPPGVLADWNRYAYYFYANAHYWAGLRAVARVLAEVDPAGAREIAQVAEQYREDILRAYRWQQARMPVVALRDGTWVPPCPSSLYCFGLTRDFFGGVSAMGHDVEVGGNHLVPLGLLDPSSREAEWTIDYMEDRWFLMDGLFGAYPAAENEQDWFTRGGFSKLQPHYTRTADIHALRDDVKLFVRTYFNTFPVLLNRETLSYWEHFNHGGGWNKTHESAWFLQMTRTMLLSERAEELWLAPFVPLSWLEDGSRICVRNAPTRFGKMTYEIRSSVGQGFINTRIEPPTRSPPEHLVIRLRHPQGKRIQSVTLDGKSHDQFDPEQDTVTVTAAAGPLALRVQYSE